MRNGLACLTLGLTALVLAACGSTSHTNGDANSTTTTSTTATTSSTTTTTNSTATTSTTANAGGTSNQASASATNTSGSVAGAGGTSGATASTGAGGAVGADNCDVKDADPIPEADFPEVIAASLCGWYDECGCSSLYADRAACEQSVIADLTARRADAQARGLSYNANCPGEVVKFHDSLGCSDNPNPGGGACYTPACSFYHGVETSVCAAGPTGPLFETNCAPGMICQMVFGEMDDFTTTCFEQKLGIIQEGEAGCGGLGTICFGDTICAEGTCRAPVGLGEPCYGSAIPYMNNCSSGFCNEEKVCEPLRDEGQPCPTLYECQEHLLCNEDNVCSPRQQLGEPCEGSHQCGVDDFCSLDTKLCIERVELGQPCRGASCVRGLRCDAEVCVEFAEPGEPCDSSVDCVIGDECLEGICVHTPSICQQFPTF